MIDKLTHFYEIKSGGDNREYRIAATDPMTHEAIIREVVESTDLIGPYEVSRSKDDSVWQWIFGHLRRFADSLPGVYRTPGFDLNAARGIK